MLFAWVVFAGIAARPTLAGTGLARPAGIHWPGAMVMPWIGPLLNLDQSRHVRMQRTKVLVVTRGSEGEREGAVGIHGLGAEFSRGNHRVRNVIVVDPGDGVAHLHLQLVWREGEVVDGHLDLVGLCPGAAERREEGRSH